MRGCDSDPPLGQRITGESDDRIATTRSTLACEHRERRDSNPRSANNPRPSARCRAKNGEGRLPGPRVDGKDRLDSNQRPADYDDPTPTARGLGQEMGVGAPLLYPTELRPPQEFPVGFEPTIAVLQTAALPLGHGNVNESPRRESNPVPSPCDRDARPIELPAAIPQSIRRDSNPRPSRWRRDTLAG